jgi:hypothetical protein
MDQHFVPGSARRAASRKLTEVFRKLNRILSYD